MKYVHNGFGICTWFSLCVLLIKFPIHKLFNFMMDLIKRTLLIVQSQLIMGKKPLYCR